MKKNILSFIIVLYSQLIFSQVGIGTPNPRGALDINKPTTNNMGLILPTNANANNLINPLGGSVVPGTIMYDSTLDCVRLYKGTNVWSNCLSETNGSSSTGTITRLNCAGATNNGTLTSGSPASGVSSVIPYTGGDGGSYAAQNVTSTGITGLTATLNAGNFANGNGSLTYTITGTPSSPGTASFAINIGGQACILERTVGSSTIPPNPDLTNTCNGLELPSGVSSTSGTVNGLSVTATYNNSLNPGYNSLASCGITQSSKSFAFYGSSSLKFNFNRKVSNLKIVEKGAVANHRITFTLKRDGIVVSPTITVSNVGTCNSSFSIGTNSVTCLSPSIGSPTDSSIIFNIGGVWFDEIVISRTSSDNKLTFLNFCLGAAQ
ncbi:hypothetical protein A0O34_14785 [Chryseobacterium glaciei]|uniref:Uncharacterized protein n=1 Tax=Chryseobacterium glaciei TaxID=1685010 RepID=A0A172XXF5_9FLAO|nr:hypothetical protein [Chryseobacterium glaciei]ANF51693.1 hypothetical protein A0O34_14785 [Chryseobacterium glaciei]